MAEIEKSIHPSLLENNPELKYLFTPQDISALRKLTKEAEDAAFNFQSVVLRPLPNEAPIPKDKPPKPPKKAPRKRAKPRKAKKAKR
jgi:hypothetical protein